MTAAGRINILPQIEFLGGEHDHVNKIVKSNFSSDFWFRIFHWSIFTNSTWTEVCWGRKAVLHYFMSKLFLSLGDLKTLFILWYQSRANIISNCSCAQKGSIQSLKQSD